mgnify:CR=1 FL=1
MLKDILKTDNSKTTIIIRLMVSLVFLSEGLQKFLRPESVGSRRFEKIGFDDFEFWANFVGTFEILCGLLLIVGIFTRISAFILVIIMAVAFFTTKIPILLEKGFLDFLHDSRTDWAMMMGSLFLLLKGSGKLGLDYLFFNSKS